MGKYVIKDIKSIVLNGKEYPYKYEPFYEVVVTPEEIRGGIGYEPTYKPIENADKCDLDKIEVKMKHKLDYKLPKEEFKKRIRADVVQRCYYGRTL